MDNFKLRGCIKYERLLNGRKVFFFQYRGFTSITYFRLDGKDALDLDSFNCRATSFHIESILLVFSSAIQEKE